MTWDLRDFGLREMLGCGLGLRKASMGAKTMEDAAQRVARFFYDCFRNTIAESPEEREARQCVLVRVYRTQRYASMEAPLQGFADRLLRGGRATPDLRCLCLLATAGEEAEWNDRRRSRGHQAIPLPSPEIVEQAPMIAALARQFGLEPASLASTEPIADLAGKTYGVFHVEQALGSEFIPAQRDFVQPYRVRSVLGFGGALRTGDVFAVLLFTRVPIGRDTADRFRSLALDVKTSFFDFDESQIYTGSRVSR